MEEAEGIPISPEINPMNDLFNTYQLNSLLLTFRSFEEHLRRADGWLLGREENGILYQCKLSLSDGKRKAARKQIAEALKQIADLVNKLDLQPVGEDPSGLIRGQLTVSWANLLDTRSKKLVRYGEIDPHLADVLDPSIDRLAQIAIDLARIFDG
jgi:hypothetical protein